MGTVMYDGVWEKEVNLTRSGRNEHVAVSSVGISEVVAVVTCDGAFAHDLPRADVGLVSDERAICLEFVPFEDEYSMCCVDRNK